MKKILYSVLILCCLALVLVSGWNLLSIYLEYHAGTSEYDRAAEAYVTERSGEEAAGPGATSQEACPISIDFDSLLAENPDVKGWIYSPDTPISYPVLKGETNDTYLHTMLNGQHNSSGSIFMDFRCTGRDEELVTILYGHHMKNGSMFASISRYRDQDYYDAHPVLWYLTPEGARKLTVLAGFVENAGADVYALFDEKAQLDAYLKEAASRSDFRPAGTMEGTEKIFLLSTCSYEYEDARYILLCAPGPLLP